MSDWPAMMKRLKAAAYLDMSEAAFEREVTAGRLPAAVSLGGRDHWSRRAIDAAIARLTGDGDVPDYRQDLRNRYGQAA
jgi:predicted DNA-binding transcriptional regulator AlpA